MVTLRISTLIAVPLLILAFSACETGLEPPPPEPEPVGAIQGTVTYSGNWPPASQLRQLFFVPLDFKPTSLLEILTEFNQGNLKASEPLTLNVESDTFFVGDLDNGTYVYNIIANQFGPNLFTDWRPVGVFDENGGVIEILGDTVQISIHVDFSNFPPFPPE